MQHVGLIYVGLGVLAFLTITAVAGIVSDYKRRRLEIEPLRAAIERGQQLDPAIIERLMGRGPQQQVQVNPMQLRIGGIITIAAAVGIALLSLFIAQIAPVAIYPILGAAVLTGCVGGGLLVAARALERPHVDFGKRGPGQ